MKLRLSIFSLLLALIIAMPYSAFADNSEATFHPSAAQKGVRYSTDALLIALPASALVGTFVMKDWKGLIEGVETAAVTAGVTYLLKYTVKEKRPDGSDWHSFPSGHSATTFAAASYLMRRYGWKFGVPAYVLSTYTAWGRCFAKKHHWYDVVVGAGIGTASAFIFTKPYAKKHNLQLVPVADASHIGIYASMEF
ncbi:MAG: phosphatase PAP2 family protein [Muribaculaceae bacterium]|nr:phosphatase PAP2 family protein [Muribaculaceae bacterium]